MLVRSRLKGQEFDLLTLAELFGEGDPAVATDDEGYYLRFSVPDELFGDGGGLHDAASVLLRRVNGVVQTLSSDLRPVGLTGASVTRAAGSTRSSGRFGRGTGSRQPGPGVGGWGPAPCTASTGFGLCAAGGTYPDVAEVLDLLGNADPAPGWAELYKVHEILLDNVPGFYQRGWVTRDQISTFRGLGQSERGQRRSCPSCRLKGDPPTRTMTLGEARQLIGQQAGRRQDL